jgi:hypothetical protein
MSLYACFLAASPLLARWWRTSFDCRRRKSDAIKSKELPNEAFRLAIDAGEQDRIEKGESNS